MQGLHLFLKKTHHKNLKMSSSDDYDDESLRQENVSESPERSFVSLKSDRSMDYPIKFGQSHTRIMKSESSCSSGPSIQSMRSDRSMDYPIKFPHGEKERDKPDVSHPSTGQLDDGVKQLSPDYPAMEDKEHQSRTGELEPVSQSFKSKLRKKFLLINEGIPMYGNVRLLNEIYTNLYITSDCESGCVNEEHEVRYIEMAHRRLPTEESINCNDIFKPLPGDEKPIRTVLTEGIAGIGKTVSVQKFVLDWADGKANHDLDFIFPFNFRELNFMKGKKLSVLELLHRFFPETKELKADDHRNKIMFIFDGLDESRFTLDFLNSKKLTDLTKSASVEVLLTNIISGNLLPSAFLWITSRPAASSQIPPTYIDRITEVRGFLDPQKDEYFQKRIGDRILANKIIAHLKSSRSLYIMCHIPVFCWMAATVFEGIFSAAETGEVPKTLTQMFTHFLILQIKRISPKYKKREMGPGEIADIVLKLGKLAFQQLEKGNLIFYEEDITGCDIDVQEATVYSGVCTQIFIEEVALHLGKVYSFVHLSVQEHLAAVYAFLSCINGNLSEQQTPRTFGLSSKATLLDLLKAAVDKALESKNGHLNLFLRFLMGLSLESNSVLLQDLMTETGRSSLSTNAAVTQKEITKYIKEKIGKNTVLCKSINLFHCLNELNDQSLVQEVQNLLSKTEDNCLHGVRLSSVQWSALAFFLLNSEEVLKQFVLKKYAASEHCLRKLSSAVTASRKALLCDCNLTKNSCEILAKALSSDYSCLQELDVSENKLQDSGFRLLSTGLKSPKCKLEVLRLGDCGLTEKSCALLASVLTSESTRLKELRLSRNKLQDSGVEQLSDALKNPHCKLEILSLSECGITQEGGAHLISALISNPSHLRELDLGRNKIGDPGIKLISDFLKNEHCKLETLKLHDCNVTEEGCVSLTAALSPDSHLRELDLRSNHLGERGLKLLSDIKKDGKYKLETLELGDPWCKDEVSWR
ncbi:NACHT, LRR and PYD domains-containing protein 3-like [Neoarius graeffei]|uniref:NACHT, LRR and PYD domains-containing protein 3-like n=1 Tax=Neoarius graeffei TaxID=443677 RepID=UPI00298CC41E|nr:NACHT, LRR and PYD domains-containing protein 3-like [Neoarius graeffei]XP_060780201.1 NACHT, LRR and PYD domains-containing protein 3-like [Neoarius graeffei]